MPAPTKLPPVDDLVKLRAPSRSHYACRMLAEGMHDRERCAQGHTLTYIAALYGVTRQAVYLKLKEAGHDTGGQRYAETLPWRVAQEHRDDWDAQMLRELAKRQQGLPPGYRASGVALDMWLEALDRAGQVVDYDREKGFIRVKRLKGDGKGYIRKPKHPKRNRPAPE